MTKPIATQTDIEFCYRPLLERTPDPTEVSTWLHFAETGQKTPQQVATLFMESAEFKNHHLVPQAQVSKLVELSNFGMHIPVGD